MQLLVSFGAVGSWSFGLLNRGLQNLGTLFGKGFNSCGAKLRLRCANRGLQNLGASCEGNVFRAFRLYEKNQKYTRGLRTSGLRGRFKALPEVTLQKIPAAPVETGFARKTPAKRL